MIKLLRIVLREYSQIKPDTKKLVFPKALWRYRTDRKFRVRVLIRLHQESGAARRKAIENQLLDRFSLELGNGCTIGSNLTIPHCFGIVIGKGVKMGDDCTIYQQVTLGKKNGKYPELGNGVTVYPGASVIGGVKLGDGAVVAPGAVVVKDVPAYTTVGGVPAKVIKERSSRP